MSLQLDPKLRVDWIVAPEERLEEDWQSAECCHYPCQPIDAPARVEDEDEEWWPGRCIS